MPQQGAPTRDPLHSDRISENLLLLPVNSPSRWRRSSVSVSPGVESIVDRGTPETAEMADEPQPTAQRTPPRPRARIAPTLLVHDPPYFLLPPRIYLSAPAVPFTETSTGYDMLDLVNEGRLPFPSPMESWRSPSPPADWVEGMSEANQCPICYERQIAKRFTCNHGLCTHCYNRMLDTAEWGISQDKLRCPLCRRPLRAALVDNIPVARGTPEGWFEDENGE